MFQFEYLESNDTVSTLCQFKNKENIIDHIVDSFQKSAELRNGREVVGIRDQRTENGGAGVRRGREWRSWGEKGERMEELG